MMSPPNHVISHGEHQRFHMPFCSIPTILSGNEYGGTSTNDWYPGILYRTVICSVMRYPIPHHFIYFLKVHPLAVRSFEFLL